MRIRSERDHRGWLLRVFEGQYGPEIAYASVRPNGLAAKVEFPSDWHEYRRAWITLGLGIIRVGLSFPWSRVVPDECQCSGPTYGFVFFADGLHLHWGKSRGRQDDPFKLVDMPWHWRHREHLVLSEPEKHPYAYRLRSGEVQERTATIRVETRRWTRFWIPWKLTKKYIDVAFDKEVGERSGTWKGGVLGCSYDMLPGESAAECLGRMELERRFE